MWKNTWQIYPEMLYYNCQEGRELRQVGSARGRTGIINAVTDLPFRQMNFFQKNEKNPLDKLHRVWYNKDS